MINVALALNGGRTKRFHTVSTIKENTVAEHTYGVIVLVLALTGGMASKNLILAALAHDMAECELGDVPAPAKRKLGIYDAFNELEEDVLRTNGWATTLTDEEAKILKIADSLDGFLFCVKEYRMGNHDIKPVLGRFASYIREALKFPEGAEPSELFKYFRNVIDAERAGDFFDERLFS